MEAVADREQRNQRRRRTRRPAPRAVVSHAPARVDERTEILMQYAPECLTPKSDRRRKKRVFSSHVAYFGDEQEPIARRLRKGWEAVVDPETKEQVTHNGMPLFRMTRDQYTETVIDPPGNESKEIIRDCLLAEDHLSREADAYAEDEEGEVEYDEE